MMKNEFNEWVRLLNLGEDDLEQGQLLLKRAKANGNKKVIADCAAFVCEPQSKISETRDMMDAFVSNA